MFETFAIHAINYFFNEFIYLSITDKMSIYLQLTLS